MEIWIIIIIFLVGWWILKHHHSTNVPSKNEGTDPVENEIEEEAVFKIQTEFERKLEYTLLPDAISGNEIYIYQNLMLPWYNKLSSENRYNDVMTKKLRNDWLNYMSALEDRSTYNYLSLEVEKKEEKDCYWDKHVVASRKAFAIEAAFASAVGKEAIDELTRIRQLNLSSFNSNGELAPEGFCFIGEKLLPKK